MRSLRVSLVGLAITITITSTMTTTVTSSAMTTATTLNVMAALEETRLPQPLSDHSATYDEGTQSIYIVGGCDDPQGNARLFPDLFVCNQITDAVVAFDPSSGQFTTKATAPRPRYRHTTANVNGQLWVVGGRTVPDDVVITEIDVYDPLTDEWTTVGTVPEELAGSDQASFAYGTDMYVLGGYAPDYTAQTALVRLVLSNDKLEVTPLAPLHVARGDVHAVQVGDYAYVTGGYTHTDGYCVPHDTTERYHIPTDEWTTLDDDMAKGRADKALVSLNQRIFAIGGESKFTCSGDPGEYTMAMDDVEVYDLTTEEWTTFPERIPERTFRFAGAAYPPTQTIYVFGGQTYYDPNCECFPTSDAIHSYTQIQIQTPLSTTNDSMTNNTSLSSGTVTWKSQGATMAMLVSFILLAWTFF